MLIIMVSFFVGTQSFATDDWGCGPELVANSSDALTKENILKEWQSVCRQTPNSSRFKLSEEVRSLLNTPFTIERTAQLARYAGILNFSSHSDFRSREVKALEEIQTPEFFSSQGLTPPTGYGDYTLPHIEALRQKLGTVFFKSDVDALIRLGLAGQAMNQEVYGQIRDEGETNAILAQIEAANRKLVEEQARQDAWDARNGGPSTQYGGDMAIYGGDPRLD